MSAQPTPAGRLAELSPAECWDLVSTTTVGRLAWQGVHSPTVIPVNFAADGRSIRIRTTAYSEAGQQCDDSAVSFQVDAVDAEGRTGWSVLMRGQAHAEYGPQHESPPPDTWLSGPRTLTLRVDVEEISGRRITS